MLSRHPHFAAYNFRFSLFRRVPPHPSPPLGLDLQKYDGYPPSTRVCSLQFSNITVSVADVADVDIKIDMNSSKGLMSSQVGLNHGDQRVKGHQNKNHAANKAGTYVTFTAVMYDCKKAANIAQVMFSNQNMKYQSFRIA